MYRLGVRPDQKGLYEQVDSPVPSLRRDSAELFPQESIPPLLLTLVRMTTKDPYFPNLKSSWVYTLLIYLFLYIFLSLYVLGTGNKCL